ncbi:hypothetical protein [Hoeflea poritis]|uniref:PepSY domain-containing protein n=1 Tax=Hoeflea poritis TaxID=2993659 RepID=A0ABT4VPR3_9HYPH|nr:hypothetical protein [Hoeflea poritis]MDA4846694.1 hypothetical protein [Hoeflea poritis]
MRTPLLSLAAFALMSFPALADRPVTDAERAKIDAALTAIGCTATDLEFDTGDNRYEVDNATCGGERGFDFELNTAFEFVDGERPVTAQEQARIDAVLSAEGCTAGVAEFDYDDNRYEVDDAICGGVRFEIDLDSDFNVLKKKRDD